MMFVKLFNPAILLSAAITSLMAVLIVIQIMIGNGVQGSFDAIRILCAMIVISIGLLTLQLYLSGARSVRTRFVLFTGALTLIAVGGFGAAWGVHLGETTGDFEYWAITLNLVLVGQGGATALKLFIDSLAAQAKPA